MLPACKPNLAHPACDFNLDAQHRRNCQICPSDKLQQQRCRGARAATTFTGYTPEIVNDRLYTTGVREAAGSSWRVAVSLQACQDNQLKKAGTGRPPYSRSTCSTCLFKLVEAAAAATATATTVPNQTTSPTYSTHRDTQRHPHGISLLLLQHLYAGLGQVPGRSTQVAQVHAS
jgi:hypothetical protein